MSDDELIKTLWTVAHYGDNKEVRGLLQMAAHLRQRDADAGSPAG